MKVNTLHCSWFPNKSLHHHLKKYKFPQVLPNRRSNTCLWGWHCCRRRPGTGGSAQVDQARAPQVCRTSRAPAHHRWHWWWCEHCWQDWEWQETGLEVKIHQISSATWSAREITAHHFAGNQKRDCKSMCLVQEVLHKSSCTVISFTWNSRRRKTHLREQNPCTVVAEGGTDREGMQGNFLG